MLYYTQCSSHQLFGARKVDLVYMILGSYSSFVFLSLLWMAAVATAAEKVAMR